MSGLFDMLENMLQAREAYENALVNSIIREGLARGVIVLKYDDGRPLEENRISLTEKGTLYGLSGDLREAVEATFAHKDLSAEDKEAVMCVLDKMRDVLSGKWAQEQQEQEQGETSSEQQDGNNTGDEPTVEYA